MEFRYPNRLTMAIFRSRLFSCGIVHPFSGDSGRWLETTLRKLWKIRKKLQVMLCLGKRQNDAMKQGWVWIGLDCKSKRINVVVVVMLIVVVSFGWCVGRVQRAERWTSNRQTDRHLSQFRNIMYATIESELK